MRTPWWKWEWDTFERKSGAVVQYTTVKRWRRGWVTLYRFETCYPNSTCVEWRLFLPFNLNVGIEYDRSY